MKPFNLEEAKAGKPVITRDNRSARIICFNAKNIIADNLYPIIALVKDKETEHILSYTNKGMYDTNQKETNYDLFMAPVKHVGYVNIYLYYQKSERIISSKIFEIEEEAINCGKQSSDYIATVKIEWEE